MISCKEVRQFLKTKLFIQKRKVLGMHFEPSYVKTTSKKLHEGNLTVSLIVYISNSDDEIKCIECGPEGKTTKKKKFAFHLCTLFLHKAFNYTLQNYI